MVKVSSFKSIVLGVAFASASLLPVHAEAPKEKPPLAELWVQTSAEYQALCFQAYGAATIQFDNWAPILEKRADGKAYLPGSDKPVAIILDLDETVVDNSGFQAFAVKTGANYSPALWEAWVEFQGINEASGRIVPGAVEFLAKMKDMGVTPIYISNRTRGMEAPTAKILSRAGIDVTDRDKRMLLKQATPAEEAKEAQAVIRHEGVKSDSLRAKEITKGEGEKEGRRSLIRQDYDVLAYFGDVYGDFKPFLEMADSSIRLFEQRQKAAVEDRQNWGKIWFILPNPMYGSWSVGQAIPKDQVKTSLEDFGFSTYVRGRRLIP